MSSFIRKRLVIVLVVFCCAVATAVKFGAVSLAGNTSAVNFPHTIFTGFNFGFNLLDGYYPANLDSAWLENGQRITARNQPQEPRMFDPSATIIVNDTTDTIHSPGCATTGTGTCSLRDAILFTNSTTSAGGGTNTIVLGAGTFNLSITGSGENLAATGDLDILAPPTGFINTLNINGAGASSTIVQWSPAVPAASRDRIFDAHPNAPPNGSITLSISGITFTGGNSVTSSGGVMLTGRPGDITNLTNSVFDNNTAFTNGGVISQSSSAATHDLNITNCVFSNNLAGGGGGAVNYNGVGTVTITNSTFSNNRTGPVGANTGGSGGALSTSGGGNGGTYNVSRNVFINNQVLNATAQGGAAINTNGTMNVSLNRFSGNAVPAPANGITLAQTGGATVNVINANDNWWGQNSGPVANDAVVLAAGGTINLTTWLQLRNTPATTPIVTGQTTTVSADILGRNSGGPISAANLVGLPTFPATSSTIFSLPVRGNLSATNGQFVNGIANLTPTFTATSAGAGSTSATADNQTIAGAITINKANTTAAILTDVPDPSIAGQNVTVTYSVAVTAPGGGTPTGNVMVSDGVDSCTGTVGAGQCVVALTTAGGRTLTATYQGDTNYNASPVSAGASHTVNAPTPTATNTSTATNTATNTPTFTPTNTPTNTPTPSDTPSVSGAITYGNAIGNPVPPRFVKNVSLSSTAGSPAVGPVITGTPGTYTLTGFGAGSYTIKPTKAGGPNGAITSNDAARVAQGVVASPGFVSQNQRFAADTSGNGNVTSNDAALIARFAAGLTGAGNAGQWKFFVTGAPSPLPTAPQTYNDSRTYASVTSSLTGEDYVAILVGEVSGNWNPATHPRPAGKVNSGQWTVDSEDGGPERRIAVELPQAVVDAGKEIIIPVSVEGVTGKDIISYEFNLIYDPAVIQPMQNPVDVTGTISRGLMVVTNPYEPGLLRVVVYGAMPIDENGVLLNLRFTGVGKSGSMSPLTFERLMFNEGEPQVMVSEGRVEISY